MKTASYYGLTPREFWQSTLYEVVEFCRGRRDAEENNQTLHAHLIATVLNAVGAKPKMSAKKLLGRSGPSLQDFGSIKAAKDWALKNRDKLPGKR